MSFRDSVKRFMQDEEGLTTVEYAVAGGLIAAAVIAAFILLGDKVNEKIGDITGNL